MSIVNRRHIEETEGTDLSTSSSFSSLKSEAKQTRIQSFKNTFYLTTPTLLINQSLWRGNTATSELVLDLMLPMKLQRFENERD